MNLTGRGERRVQKGEAAPRWRDVERDVAKHFAPPLEMVRQNPRAIAFFKQMNIRNLPAGGRCRG